ncbi:MAG: sensor histidine kinase [Mycobacterium leprae]
MQQRNAGPGDPTSQVKQIVAGLEREKERIAQAVDNARSQYDRISQAVARLEPEAWALAADIEQLQHQASSARYRLEQIVDAIPGGVDDVKAAFAALVEATVQMTAAQEREKWLKAQIDFYQEWAQGAAPLTQDGASLVEEIANAIQFVTANFREFGSRMDRAKETKALGLHVIRAQEEERRRLAREIHDGPTQLLNSVVLRIDVCQRYFESDLPRLKEELNQLKELVRLSLQDVRKIIFYLRPMTLDDLGVIPAIRAYLKDFQGKTGIETDYAVFGNDRRYDQAYEIAIFRIVQEALANVYKHAYASRVWVKVETAGGKEIKVTVKDDGVGFDPSQVRPGVAGTKFGLAAMRERAELIGGTMEIQSAPGQGTKVSFSVPLPE